MSNRLIELIVKFFSWGIMGVSVIMAVVFFLRISGADTPDQEIAVAESFILWAFILLGIAAFFSIVFPIFFIAQNPKNAIKALVGLISLGVVFLFGYLLADTTPIVTATSATEPNFSNPSVLRFADTGILSTYILFGIAVFSLLFTGVRSIIKL